MLALALFNVALGIFALVFTWRKTIMPTVHERLAALETSVAALQGAPAADLSGITSDIAAIKADLGTDPAPAAADAPVDATLQAQPTPDQPTA